MVWERDGMNGRDKGNQYVRTRSIKDYIQIAFKYKLLGSIVLLMSLIVTIIYYIREPNIYQGKFDIYYNREDAVNIKIQGQSNYNKPKKNYWFRVMKSMKPYIILKDLSGFPYKPSVIKSFFEVSTERENDVFHITVSTKYPGIIPQLASYYLEVLNTLDKNNISKNYRDKLSYLRKQLQNKKDELQQIERKIQLAGSRLDISNLENIQQVKKFHNDFKQKLKNSEIELAYVQASKRSTERELNSLNDTLFNQSSFTEPLKVQLMNLQVDLARALTKYGEQHPTVNGIRENISQVKEMLRKGFEQNVEIKNIKANPIKRDLMGKLVDLKIKEVSLKAKIHSLQNKVDSFEKQITSDKPGSKLYHLLKRREPLLSTIDLLNEKIIDIEMAMEGTGNSFSIINAPGKPNRPANKNLIMYIFKGLLAGLGLAAGSIFVYDLLDDRLKLVDEVKNFFSFPIIGTLHQEKMINNKIFYKNFELDEIYNHFDNEMTEIRINSNQLIKSQKHKILSIISPNRKDGKTIIANLLAMAFAKNRRKVLLIDYDTLIPKTTKLLDSKEKTGLQNFLLADAEIDEIVHSSTFENLDFIPSGENQYDIKLHYDTEKANRLLKYARENYDIVIVDTPAMNPHPEIFDLIEKTDKAIISVRMNKTTKSDIEGVLKKMEKLEDNLLGTIITGTRFVPFGSYYESSTRYYNYYKDYYGNEKKKTKKNKSEEKTDPVKQDKSDKKNLFTLLLILLLLIPLGITSWFLRQTFGKWNVIPSGNNQLNSSQKISQKFDNSDQNVTKQQLYPKNLDNKEKSYIVKDSLSQNLSKQKQIKPDEQKKDKNNPQINQEEQQKGKNYIIVLGCFDSKENAINYVKKLNYNGVDASIQGTTSKGLFRVAYGVYSNRKQALQNLNEIKNGKYKGAWVDNF